MVKYQTRKENIKKSIKNKLRIFNFRLSIEDVKKINRFGMGKNSSEKLRYILKKYKCDKINSKTRRAAYQIEKSSDTELLDKKFKHFINTWEKCDKNEFLINSSLVNIMNKRKIHKVKHYIEHNPNFSILKNLNWIIDSIDFNYEEENKFLIGFQKENQTIKMYLSKSEEDLTENTHLQSDKEEELFSFLFNDLQKNIISSDFEIETENFLDKKYANGDNHKMLDYGNITIVEFEYIEESKTAVLTMVKENIN